MRLKVAIRVDGENWQDMTKYLAEPIYFEEKLNEELDSGQITLNFVPTELYPEPFHPKTWIILDVLYDDGSSYKNIHMVVDRDDIEQYVGKPDMLCHKITMIEPSVIAQGMHPDNISVTYELSDVTLNYEYVNPSDDTIGTNMSITNQGVSQGEYNWDSIKYGTLQKPGSVTTNSYVNLTYVYMWDNTQNLAGKKYELDGLVSQIVTFDAPELWCYVVKATGIASGSNLERLFQMQSTLTVTVWKMLDGRQLSQISKDTYECGAVSHQERDDTYAWCTNTSANVRGTNAFDYPSSNNQLPYDAFWQARKNYEQSVANPNFSNTKTITVTTPALTQSELDNGYTITVQIVATPKSSSMTSLVKAVSNNTFTVKATGNYTQTFWALSSSGSVAEFYSSTAKLEASYNCADPVKEKSDGIFTRAPTKYSLWDLLRKAIMTVETPKLPLSGGLHDFDILNLPIKIHPNSEPLLKATSCYETVFQQKNLWEIFIQVGYYIHGIPRLSFAPTDNPDYGRLWLSYDILGSDTRNNSDNVAVTVYNYRPLSDYISAFDSYVSNFYNPETIVTEHVVAKCSDSSYRVSNDNAEIILSNQILEIIKLEVSNVDAAAYDPMNYMDITNYVFEQSIYQILSSENPEKVKPAKGNRIYYAYGDNKITGLSFTTKKSDGGEYYTAIKNILIDELRYNPGWWIIPNELYVNQLTFRVTYRTRINPRITQLRPDIHDYISNAVGERLPRHDQFFGQQDEMVDSIRYSQNLYGKLIRTGNDSYQISERVQSRPRVVGEIARIAGADYYITEIENEYYNNVHVQKISLSKNYNQLSQIVTLPSEPRFYEVATNNLIPREIRLLEMVELGRSPASGAIPNLQYFRDLRQIYNIMFTYDVIAGATQATYAVVTFLADPSFEHKSSNGFVTAIDKLFPSSLIDRKDPNSVKPESSSDRSKQAVPVVYLPLFGGVIYRFCMQDNFSAGDFLDTQQQKESGTDKRAYYPMIAKRYVDVYGRADLLQFQLLAGSTNLWHSLIQDLPNNPSQGSLGGLILATTDGTLYGNTQAIAIEKDNREIVAINLQLSANIAKSDTKDDRIVMFNYLFLTKDETKVLLYADTIIQTRILVNLDNSKILEDEIMYYIDENATNEMRLYMRPNANFGNIDWSQVKSMVIYYSTDYNDYNACIAINIDDYADADKINASLYIRPANPRS